MKITVKKEVYEEIEIEFPVYRKKYPFYYKILNGSNFMKVECNEHWEDAGINKIKNSATVSEVLSYSHIFKTITEDEFNEALTNASRFIRQSLTVKNNY